MIQGVKLVFVRDDTTRSGFHCGEHAAFDLDRAAELVARGVARIADEEPEREALQEAVRAYRATRGKS
jgi:phage terminase Nu1 subunit (DNA packaging protein)